MPVTVVVLAAGQGKRMNSELPKVLQPLAGRPLLGHVLKAARALEPAAIHVVYGHGGDLVRAAFPDSDLEWTLQSEQLGTGHAHHYSRFHTHSHARSGFGAGSGGHARGPGLHRVAPGQCSGG